MAKKKDDSAELDPRILAVSKHLQKLRKEAGFTSYEQFAHAKDLPRMQYWRLEKGANCTLASLLKVLDAHEMSFYDFFKGLEKEKNTNT